MNYSHIVKCMDCMLPMEDCFVMEDVQVVPGYKCSHCGCSVDRDTILRELEWDGFKVVSTPESHSVDSRWTKNRH
jgi:hypothetical protein